MRAIGLAGLAAFALSACGHEAGVGPAGIPFACADGKVAWAYYEGGGYFPRGTVRIAYDGRDMELRAVPPTYGLRYVSEGGEGGHEGAAGAGHEGGAEAGHEGAEAPVMIWSVRGEEAWLSQLDPGQSEERELTHCTRIREGVVPTPPVHSEGHGAEH